MHELVIDDSQLLDLSGDFRSDACDLDTNPTVTRPGRCHIKIPRHDRYEHRDECDGKCREPPQHRRKKPASAFDGRRYPPII